MIQPSCSSSGGHSERGPQDWGCLDALRITDRSVWKRTDSAPTFSMVGLCDTGNRRKGGGLRDGFARTWCADENDDDGERKDRESASGQPSAWPRSLSAAIRRTASESRQDFGSVLSFDSPTLFSRVLLWLQAEPSAKISQRRFRATDSSKEKQADLGVGGRTTVASGCGYGGGGKECFDRTGPGGGTQDDSPGMAQERPPSVEQPFPTAFAPRI
jgi:hypothetical protein